MGESAVAPERAWNIASKSITRPDGVSIYYEVLGRGERTLMLANGLGGRLYSWEPLIRALHDRFRLITWDYRGLFESACDGPCRLSVRDHAEDAFEILAREGVERAVWVGWSMGVQVTLEAAALAPERMAGMILLNGTYGHIFSSALQPGIRVPLLPRYMHEVLETVRASRRLAQAVTFVGKRGLAVALGFFWLGMGRRALELRPMLAQYAEDVYREDSFLNYLRLFQELDGHSAYHHLPQLRAPALVVSGRWDVLTPAYQSRAIARRLPQAEHLHLKNGSHFVLLERPETVLPRVEEFLAARVRW
jgi:pimeloyl-ACP methyl ester carboxylesterase